MTLNSGLDRKPTSEPEILEPEDPEQEKPEPEVDLDPLTHLEPDVHPEPVVKTERAFLLIPEVRFSQTDSPGVAVEEMLPLRGEVYPCARRTLTMGTVPTEGLSGVALSKEWARAWLPVGWTTPEG